MPNWSDTAFVIAKKPYGENSGLITLFTQHHGIYKSYVHNIKSKTNRGIFQSGNLINVTWQGKLEDSLGFFKGEIIKPYASLCMISAKKSHYLNLICELCLACMPERNSASKIFSVLNDFIEKMDQDKDFESLYVLFEFELLCELGFKLDLESCAATGQTHNLTFVSPKSGRAVSAEAGLPYASKLFKLPQFLLKYSKEHCLSAINDLIITNEDILNGLRLCHYFLEKYFFTPYQKQLPDIRLKIASLI